MSKILALSPRKKALAVALITLLIAVPVVIAEGPFLHDEDVSITGYLEVAGDTILGSVSVLPDGTTHIYTASAGVVSANGNADDLIVEGSSNAGISILTPNTDVGWLIFGDPDNSLAGYLQYDHANTQLAIGIEGTARYYFDDFELQHSGVWELSTSSGAITVQPATDSDINLDPVGTGVVDVLGDMDVSGDLTVNGTIYGELAEDLVISAPAGYVVEIGADSTVELGTLRAVTGDTIEVDDNMEFQGARTISNTSGNLTVDPVGYLDVIGDLHVGGDVEVSGDVQMGEDLSFVGVATISNTAGNIIFDTVGDVQFNDELSFYLDGIISSDGDLHLVPDAGAGNDVYIGEFANETNLDVSYAIIKSSTGDIDLSPAGDVKIWAGGLEFLLGSNETIGTVAGDLILDPAGYAVEVKANDLMLTYTGEFNLYNTAGYPLELRAGDALTLAATNNDIKYEVSAGDDHRWYVDATQEMSLSASEFKLSTGNGFAIGSNFVLNESGLTDSSGSFTIDVSATAASLIFDTGSNGDVYTKINGSTELWIDDDGTYNAFLYGSGYAGGSWVDGSDRRLKTNIVPVESLMDRIRQIDVVRYNSIEGGRANIGIIAQDLDLIMKELVFCGDTSEDGMCGISAYQLASVGVKGIQELYDLIQSLSIPNYDAQIAALESQVAILETQVATLEAGMIKLEARMAALEGLHFSPVDVTAPEVTPESTEEPTTEG